MCRLISRFNSGSTDHKDLLDSQVAQFYDNVAWYRSLPSIANPLSQVRTVTLCVLNAYAKHLFSGAQMGVGITISCPDPYELAGGTWKEPIGFTDAWSNVADPWEWLVSGYAWQDTF